MFKSNSNKQLLKIMALGYILASVAIVAIGIFTYNHRDFFTSMANPVPKSPVSIYSNNDFILEYDIRFINDNYVGTIANGSDDVGYSSSSAGSITHSLLTNLRP